MGESESSDEPTGSPTGPPSVSRRPGDGTVSRSALARDATVRRWGLVTPSATRIGRADSPDGDLSDDIRRLHEERHPAMEGYSERAHRLDKLRITHALTTSLSLTPWQRDRAIGVMIELDLTAFGSRRAIETVALVVIRHVVDTDRKRYLGLDDTDWIQAQSPERMATLYEQFTSLTDDPAFRHLCEQQDLDTTSLNRLRRVLKEQLDEQELHGVAYGRNPDRDSSLPDL
ncbi:DNA-directed RNA polymerase subunit epsilon [Halocatena halophila]|uniref:DNA-directed RNA polymerase subunit epsilon n=1 Tax=Halocatena halophila TaxID=2814576 RepID=UPI002ED4634A